MKGRLWITVCAMVALVLPGATSLNSDSSATDDSYFLSEPEGSGAPQASFYCPSITNVAVFENRIHLKCSVANGSILYYAYSTDPGHVDTADQILAVGNTAFVLGRGVYVFYYNDSGLNPPGCNISDCRGLSGVSMV